MKWFLRIVPVVVIAITFSFFNITIDADTLNVLFTVLGIMFPIMLSQIMSFSFVSVKNSDFVLKYRENLNAIRIISVVLFSTATILLLLKQANFYFFNFLFYIFYC